MSQPGSKVKLPNPLLIRVDIDPDKLGPGRGPYAYYTARRTASGPLDTRGITISGLPTTGAPATVVGRRKENKIGFT